MVSLSQISMQGKLLKCTETMSWLCNGLAGMFFGVWMIKFGLEVNCSLSVVLSPPPQNNNNITYL